MSPVRTCFNLPTLFLFSFANMKRVTKIAGALLLPAAVLAQNATTVNITSAILSSGTVDLGNWADAYVKATTLVSQVTQAEKISIITGGSVSGSVNWTALEFKDGTQGVQGKTARRKIRTATNKI